MNEEMRREFEEWAVSHQYTIRPAVTNCGVIIDEKYGHHSVQIAWESWQASREALKPIKLPPATFETPSGDNALREDAVIDAIYAAGYKVAP